MQQEPKIFEVTDRYTARDVAAFVADYAEELAEMAGRAGLKFLSQLLTMVSMEAGSILAMEMKEQPDEPRELPVAHHQIVLGTQAPAEPL
jgi:hypothetical protein